MQHFLVRFGQARSLRATNARIELFSLSHAFSPVSSPDAKFLDASLPTKQTAFPDLKGNSNPVASVACSGPMSKFLGNLRLGKGLMNVKGSIAPLQFTASFRSFINAAGSERDVQPRRRPMEFYRGQPEGNGKDMAGPARSEMDVQSVGRSSRSMDFVRGILEENETGVGSSRYGGPEQNPDIVHIKLIRNNTFIAVTDSKGNKKIGASSGCLPEMKGGASRYAAEATAEHVGRMARNLGLKSVVMKVKGFTYFKKKRQAIMSWREGYTYSRGDLNPIVYIEDATRRAHNGCRLPKQRRT